jgi:O-antigen ligase
MKQDNLLKLNNIKKSFADILVVKKGISEFVPIFFSFFLLFSFHSISIGQIFLCITFIIWIISLALRKIRFDVPGYFWPLAVYAALSLIASAASVNPGISFHDSRELLLFLIIPIVFTGFTRDRDIKIAMAALLLSALVSILYSFFCFFVRYTPGDRIAGFMGHYMTQAGLLVLFSSLALSMFLFTRKKTRFAWGGMFILAVIALVLTLTRSAWIGILVAGCVILFMYKPKTLILVPIVAGLFFIISPKPIKNRALTIFKRRSYSNMERLEYIHAGIQIIKDYPLFGTGPDTVDMVFQDPKYGLSESAKRNVHLHNNFLQIAAERGIFSFLAWMTFVVWTLVSLIKVTKNKDPSLRSLAVGALAGFLALLAAGLFEYNFGDSEILVLILFIITIPFVQEKIIKKKKAEISD